MNVKICVETIIMKIIQIIYAMNAIIHVKIVLQNRIAYNVMKKMTIEFYLMELLVNAWKITIRIIQIVHACIALQNN